MPHEIDWEWQLAPTINTDFKFTQVKNSVQVQVLKTTELFGTSNPVEQSSFQTKMILAEKFQDMKAMPLSMFLPTC